MITILKDIQGINVGNTLTVPFTLDDTQLKNEPLKVEVYGAIGGNITTLPKGVVSCVVSDGVEQTMDTIQPEHFGSLFVARINLNTYALSGLYIRVYNKFIAWTTPKIHVSGLMEMDFHTVPKILNFRPKTVQITDNVECTYNNAICALTKDKFNIQVLISNNAGSESPIWEDVTEDYLAHRPLVFKNSEKDDNTSWSVSVRYKISKTISDSTIQISDIALLVL